MDWYRIDEHETAPGRFVSSAPKDRRFIVASRGLTRDDGSWQWEIDIGWRQEGSGRVLIDRGGRYPALWAELPSKELIA